MFLVIRHFSQKVPFQSNAMWFAADLPIAHDFEMSCKQQSKCRYDDTHTTFDQYSTELSTLSVNWWIGFLRQRIFDRERIMLSQRSTRELCNVNGFLPWRRLCIACIESCEILSSYLKRNCTLLHCLCSLGLFFNKDLCGRWIGELKCCIAQFQIQPL